MDVWQGSFIVVKNAIDIDKFRYSAEKERQIRDEFGCENAHIYGHIGNFVYAKNHLYLLDIFEEIHKLDPDAHFFMVGEGELRKEIEDKLANLSARDKIHMTGMRYDVPSFMSAFDMMIFPSIYEGLPLTLVEAQASGLKMLISDVITKGVEVTKGLVEYESIQKSPAEWAEKIVKSGVTDKEENRVAQKESIASFGYDIDTLCKWYEEFLSDKNSIDMKNLKKGD